LVVPPEGLLSSQEIFRQNSLHHGEGEAVGEVGTAIEEALCFLPLRICDSDSIVLGESINFSCISNKTGLELYKNGTSLKIKI
jgi:hypothetical protein